MTDPIIEREYLSKPDGTYRIEKPALCVSLGEPHKGYYYKLIASILYADRFK